MLLSALYETLDWEAAGFERSWAHFLGGRVAPELDKMGVDVTYRGKHLQVKSSLHGLRDGIIQHLWMFVAKAMVNTGIPVISTNFVAGLPGRNHNPASIEAQLDRNHFYLSPKIEPDEQSLMRIREVCRGMDGIKNNILAAAKLPESEKIQAVDKIMDEVTKKLGADPFKAAEYRTIRKTATTPIEPQRLTNNKNKMAGQVRWSSEPTFT